MPIWILLLLIALLAVLLVFKIFRDKLEEKELDLEIQKPVNAPSRAQLQVLMSSEKVASDYKTSPSKKIQPVVESDCLNDLLELDRRISKNMEILLELAKSANDFTMPLASGRIAKHQLFGSKFLNIVRNRTTKVKKLKSETDLSEKKIRDIVIRDFTVEMNVMSDLIDRQSYTTAVSWADLDSMLSQFEADVKDVQKLIKAGQQA